MLINGRNIKEFNALVYSNNLQPSLEGINAAMGELVLLVRNHSKEQLSRDISYLIDLSKEGALSDLGDSFEYDVKLERYEDEYKGIDYYTNKHTHLLTLSFTINYRMTGVRTITLNTGINEIYNEGNRITPVTLILKSLTDMSEVSISGFNEEVKVINLLSNETIEVNGQQQTIKSNNANIYTRYKSWTFPNINPGISKISIPPNLEVSMEYKPRWV